MSPTFRLALGLSVLAACSQKPPPNGESPRSPQLAMSGNGVVTPPMGAAPAAAPDANADPREAELAAVTLHLFENDHLLRPKIDDNISNSAFKMYMERLDSEKMFLLKADTDALGKYETQIDDELRSGDLKLAHEGSAKFVARVAVVDKDVQQLLAAPFDLTKPEMVELDAKKLTFAATEDELKDRWRQRLELEVLERVEQMDTRLHPEKEKATKPHAAKKAPPPPPPPKDIPATFEGQEAKARADLAKSYAARFTRLEHPGALDAASDLVNSVALSLDPHTDYLPPADKANFDIAMTGSLEGIGAVLREKDHLIEIAELVPGGASWRQGGLTPGDLILSVISADGKDPVDVTDMPIEDVVHMIRGPKGTVVHLRIQKASGEQTLVSITRDDVVVEETYARGAMLTRKGLAGFGYIHLPSFYGGKGKSQRTAAGDVG
ncbi:MAG TPA: PDZ domain-containing protein, partial [Kofleriaceae bacterium]